MLGFIGLGSMGGAIVSRLLSQQVAVVAFDNDGEALRRQVTAGACAANSAAEVADRADIVMACLPSVEASLAVAHEVARGTRAKVYAELSTIGREAIGQIEKLLQSHGIQVIDAPISGGVRAAESGTLSMMLAGPSPAIERVTAEAAGFSKSTLRIGAQPGQAQLCKLVNNAINFTAFLVSCEAVTTGVAAGIDASMLVDIINAGTGRNSGTTHKIPQTILPRTFNLGGGLGAALKDLDLYLAEAGRANLPPGVVAETRSLWAKASTELGPEQDAAHIIRYFESRLGVEVKG